MPLSEKNTLTGGIIVHLLVSFPAQPDDSGVVTPPFELWQLCWCVQRKRQQHTFSCCVSSSCRRPALDSDGRCSVSPVIRCRVRGERVNSQEVSAISSWRWISEELTRQNEARWLNRYAENVSGDIWLEQLCQCSQVFSRGSQPFVWNQS